MAINYTGKPGPVKGQYEQFRQMTKSAGPGMAYSRAPSRNPASTQPVPQQGQQSAPDMSMYSPRSSGGMATPAYGAQQQAGGFPSPPPQTVNGAPVATVDPSKYQRQIDEMKQRGTWDDPRNAKARERLEQKLADANRAPPGYFFTPDGRLEPNYIFSLHGPPQQSSPTIPADQRNAVAQQFGMNPSGVGQLYAPTQQPPVPMPAVPNTASGGLQNQLAMRDAFIASINNSLMQQQLANGLNAQGAIPPQLNFPVLYQQAQQMVADGWTNPLAALLG